MREDPAEAGRRRRDRERRGDVHRAQGGGEAGRGRNPHLPHRPRPDRRRAQHPARNHAVGQDDADAPHGGAREAELRPGPVPRRGRHRRSGSEAQRLDGLPAVHQLPAHDRVREHRVAVAGDRRARIRDRAARRRRRGPARSRPDAEAAPGRAFRRTAAANRDRAGARQGFRPRAARRAARQPRLQAPGGVARGTPRHTRREGRDHRVRDQRAAGGAAPRRIHRHPAPGSGHAVRTDARRLPQAEGPGERPGLRGSAAQHPPPSPSATGPSTWTTRWPGRPPVPPPDSPGGGTR